MNEFMWSFGLGVVIWCRSRLANVDPMGWSTLVKLDNHDVPLMVSSWSRLLVLDHVDPRIVLCYSSFFLKKIEKKQ